MALVLSSRRALATVALAKGVFLRSREEGVSVTDSDNKEMKVARNCRAKPVPALGLAWVLATCLLCSWVGCGGGGDGPDRYDLSGNVTFKGSPVPAGRVVFEPDSSAGNSGPQGFSQIENGRYDTSIGKGTVGGPHIMRITGLSSAAAPENEDTPVEPLFAEYQTKADLPKEKSTMDFDVPASAATAVPSGQPTGSGGGVHGP